MLKQIALLCAALFLVLHPKTNAQVQNPGQKEVAFDSMAVKPGAAAPLLGKFVAESFQVYQDGTSKAESNVIGDSITTYRAFMQVAWEQTSRLANDVWAVQDHDRRVGELSRFLSNLRPVIGRSPLDSLRNLQANLYETGWKVTPRGGSATNIRFRVTGAGAFQWRADTATQWRGAVFISNALILRQLGGVTHTFYRNPSQNGRWRTNGGAFRLSEPGATASLTRNALDAPEEPEPADLPPPTVTLNDNGTVSFVEGGRIVTKKFVTKNKKKQWVLVN